MRHPNGYGSVYKLSGNRRRPWVARVTTGWDGPKQLYQFLGYFADRKDALAALASHHSNPAPRAKITLDQVYEEWSTRKYKSGISRSMADGYRAAWKYLSKAKDVTMRELRTVHMQEVIDQCHADGKSKSHLQKVKTLCAQLFGYALKNDIALKDYSEYVQLPKFDEEDKKRFSDLEVKKIADSKLPWADTVLMLIYTGFRINEFLGLTRFQVDLERKELTGGSKTDAGKNRVVPIHPKILPLVEEWYAKGGQYLICMPDGGRVDARWYREKVYRPLLAKIGVRVLNPHACRHTCASRLHDAGADAKTIQEILGHASYTTTADTYTHVTREKLQKEMQKIPG